MSKKSKNNKNKNAKKKKTGKSKGGSGKQNASTLSNLPKSLAGLKSMGDKMSMVRSVCSITDPFCAAAYGRRYPDAEAARTMTEDMVTIVPLTTATNSGSLLAYFCPGNNPVSTYLSIAGSPLTTPATLAAGIASNMSTSADSFRVTSVGIRFYCTLSATNAAGYIIIGKTNCYPFNTTCAPGSTNYEEVKTFPLVHGGEYCVILKPLGTGTRVFQSMGDLTNTDYNGALNQPSFENCVIEIVGAPFNSTVLAAEVVIHAEWIPAKNSGTLGSAFARLTGEPPVENTFLQRASNAVYNRVEGIVFDGVTAVGRMIEGAAKAYVMSKVPSSAPFLALVDG